MSAFISGTSVSQVIAVKISPNSEDPMRVQFLVDSGQRSTGAMFTHSLQDELLVFLYPIATRHLFHTFFCPSLRMVALDENGLTLFDQVIQPNHFVRLPASQIILECSPETEYQPYVES